MDFNKIKTFITIVECGSVSKAAQALHRTQSAISQQIDVLEGELGITLFESLRGSVLLTKEGQKIFQSTREHFGAIENCVSENINALGDMRGTIRIGASPSIGHYLLPKLVAAFQKTHPRVDLELILQPDEKNEAMLKEDQIDAGFIINFENRKLFDTSEFTSFNEDMVCSSSYFKIRFNSKKNSVKNFSTLENMTLIDFESDAPNIRHWLKKNLPNSKITMPPDSSAIAVEDNECIKRFVQEGIGVAMLPEYMIASEARLGKIVSPFPKSKSTVVGLDFAMRKGKNISRCLEAFVLHVRKWEQAC